jgi:hypothetical protein
MTNDGPGFDDVIPHSLRNPHMAFPLDFLRAPSLDIVKSNLWIPDQVRNDTHRSNYQKRHKEYIVSFFN